MSPIDRQPCPVERVARVYGRMVRGRHRTSSLHAHRLDDLLEQHSVDGFGSSELMLSQRKKLECFGLFEWLLIFQLLYLMFRVKGTT